MDFSQCFLNNEDSGLFIITELLISSKNINNNSWMLSAISTQSLKFPGGLINVFLHLINLSQSPIIPWSCNHLVPALRKWGAGTWVWGPPGYKVLSKQTNKIQSFANYIYLIWWLMWFNNNNNNTSFSFLLFISPLLPGSSWCRCHQNVCLQNILILGGVTPTGIALAHRPVHLVPRDSVRRPNHLSPNWLYSPRALSGYLPTPVFAMRWWYLLTEVFISWMRNGQIAVTSHPGEWDWVPAIWRPHLLAWPWRALA